MRSSCRIAQMNPIYFEFSLSWQPNENCQVLHRLYIRKPSLKPQSIEGGGGGGGGEWLRQAERHSFTSHKYYTIIDFNEVDIRIYLPEKVMIHRGH